MTKPKTKRAPRKPKDPEFGNLGTLSAAQAKAAVKKSVEEFVAASRQGHKMPPASPTGSEDRVLSQVETLDDQAHDLLMELGRSLSNRLAGLHIPSAIETIVDNIYPLTSRKKGKRNA